MKKVAVLSIVILVCLCCSCVLRKAAVPSGQYTPVQCDLVMKKAPLCMKAFIFLSSRN